MIVGIIPVKKESVLILRMIIDVSVNLAIVEKIVGIDIVRLITELTHDIGV